MASPPRVLTDSVYRRLIEAVGPKPRILVAYSGGLDSTTLAHLLVSRRRQLGRLRLVHVDHGLQSASRQWSAHCRRQARQWHVPFVGVTARVSKSRGESVEAAARDARYQALAKVLETGEVLVTAQHRDDQVETLLLQLFRGAGVSGLAAMPYQAPFSTGLIVRPLLDVPRVELEAYAHGHKLDWLEDPTNLSDRFDRNFLRNEIMPRLRRRWPGIGSAIPRSARHMAEAAELLQMLARGDLASVVDGPALSVPALRSVAPGRRKNLLRLFIGSAGFDMPSESKLLEMAGSLLASRPDAQPEVRWPGAVMRRRAGRLELHAEPEVRAAAAEESATKSWRWRREREFALNTGSLRLIDDPDGPIDLDRLPGTLELRPRQGGESLRPGARARTKALKKLMQAARLTIEERARLPLLFGGGPQGRLLAAGDRWLDASVLATVKSSRRARLLWSRGK